MCGTCRKPKVYATIPCSHNLDCEDFFKTIPLHTLVGWAMLLHMAISELQTSCKIQETLTGSQLSVIHDAHR